MTACSRQLLVGALAIATFVGTSGCAKDPTAVYTIVDVDETVPPVLKLRSTITRTSDPSQWSSGERSSPNGGDAADRPGPWVFPVGLELTVDESFAGPVTVTIESLDWDTDAVLATGNAPAIVVARRTVVATLTMTAGGGTPRDGGSDGSTDAGADGAP
jgi:hypothetical protein